MKFYVGAPDCLAPELIFGHALYRYKVFVKKLGWNLRTADGMELDEFDRPDTLYVVARSNDEVISTARLLPTTRASQEPADA